MRVGVSGRHSVYGDRDPVGRTVVQARLVGMSASPRALRNAAVEDE